MTIPAPPTDHTFPFVSRMTAAAQQQLRALPIRRAKSGEQLLERGARSAGAFLVVGGRLRVYSINGKGREATLYDVEPGGTCILALAATFSGEPYPAWVQAGPAGARYVRLAPADFRRLFDCEPAFREFVFGVLSGRVLELMRSLEEHGSASVEQRVARYLLRHAGPDGVVAIAQSALAAELGTAREVVFRALRSLAARDLIVTRRLSVSIRDARELTRLGDLDV